MTTPAARRRPTLAPLLLVVLLAVAAGCGRDLDSLKPVPPNTDPVVFDDTFGDGVDFQAFLGSKFDAVDIDANERFEGTASLRVTVPAPSDPSGSFAGGAFVTNLARDLSGYNALTFQAKSSKPSALDVAGLANDNTGTSKYEASRAGIPLTTSWSKVIVPIPLPAKLSVERGLFFFAEGSEDGSSHTVWFDDVRFETVSTIANPRPSMTTQTLSAFVGGTVTVSGTQVIFDVAGADVIMQHFPSYFTFMSSDPSVAAITGGGEVIRVVGPGTATITASLGAVPATGEVTVNASAPPSVAAPRPTLPAADVISLFSNAYTNVPVDTWSAPWDRADVSDLKVQGDDVKGYTNMSFAGIEFTSQTIDASAMTHFHIDVWVPQGSLFKVKLVDFGADGQFGGAPDSEHELTLTAATTPPFSSGTWASLDIPLADFTRLVSREHVAQLIISGDTNTAFVDNIYFHK